jgi:hypothetical protein
MVRHAGNQRIQTRLIDAATSSRRNLPAARLNGCTVQAEAASLRRISSRSDANSTSNGNNNINSGIVCSDYPVADHPWPASRGRGAPHAARVQPFNITWRYANRRSVTARAKHRRQEPGRYAPRRFPVLRIAHADVYRRPALRAEGNVA